MQGKQTEFELEERIAASLACYMTEEHKSDEAEYLAAKAKLMAAAEAA